MGHRPGAALFQGQAGLRPVERLNLAFLVDGQHERLLRRIESYSRRSRIQMFVTEH
jgi:phage regulator Rha-like protein